MSLFFFSPTLESLQADLNNKWRGLSHLQDI